LKLRVGGADTSTNYYTRTTNFSGSNSVFSGGTNNTTAFDYIGADRNGYFAGTTEIYRPFETEITQYTNYSNNAGTGETRQVLQSGFHNASTSFDGFSVIPDGGTTISGTIYVYGYGI
jgi:hypothetical protein